MGTTGGSMRDAFGRRDGRPDHPDFWRISEDVVKRDSALDGSARADKDDVWRRLTGDVVDVDTVVYVATQRALRAFPQPTTRAEAQRMATVVSLWIDGFVAGAGFQKAGGHEAPDGTP